MRVRSSSIGTAELYEAGALPSNGQSVCDGRVTEGEDGKTCLEAGEAGKRRGPAWPRQARPQEV